MTQIDMAGVSVMLAMPVNRDLPWQTALSLCETTSALSARGISFGVEFQVGCSVIEMARSRAVHSFLKSDKQRLFWIDSDIRWKSDDFIRLLALSSRLECVGGIYPRKSDPPQFMFDLDDHSSVQSNEFGCLSIKGMGLGFTVVQRGVIEQLAANAPKLMYADVAEPVAHCFRCDMDGERYRGEDFAFFSDVRALGFEVWLDPTIQLGHVGTKEYMASFSSILHQETDNEEIRGREELQRDGGRASAVG